MSAKLRSLVVFMLVVVGCEGRNEVPLPASEHPITRTEKQALRVVVPAEVRGQWAAVKIAVSDKEVGSEEVYEVAIGTSSIVADSGLELEVKHFLPAFIMDGAVMTSASSETRNPGAQVVIREDGHEIFKGWLFSRYPATHAFEHPRYAFALVGFVPAEEIEKKD